MSEAISAIDDWVAEPLFRDVWAMFHRLILAHSPAHPFVSFDEGIAAAEEGYILPLRRLALERLDIERWNETGSAMARFSNARSTPSNFRRAGEPCWRRGSRSCPGAAVRTRQPQSVCAAGFPKTRPREMLLANRTAEPVQAAHPHGVLSQPLAECASPIRVPEK